MSVHRPVMPLIVLAPFSVQAVCTTRAVSSTGHASIGDAASCGGASSDRRRPEPGQRSKAEGKIKGRGTLARQKPCLHVGEGSTHLEWQRAVRGAKPALALKLPCALFAGLRRTSMDSVP